MATDELSFGSRKSKFIVYLIIAIAGYRLYYYIDMYNMII